MRRLFQFLIILALVSPVKLKGQGTPVNTTEVLEKLFSRLVNNYVDTDRMRINDSIRIIVDSYVRSDSIFQHRFTNLKYLGQVLSSDSLIKIVTWNLVLTGTPGRYFCYIIKKGEKGKGNRVYSLTASYSEKEIKTDTAYTASDWYGALYYDLRPCIFNDLRYWVLLGIDYSNLEISRKVIDVLSFTNDGEVLFGRKWFESVLGFRFRAVFQYASNGIMSLRFSSDKSIVFDHLVPFNPWQKDDHQFYGPDYSYDAYNFEKGFWKLSLNVDARNPK
jgi:hypothetical protein